MIHSMSYKPSLVAFLDQAALLLKSCSDEELFTKSADDFFASGLTEAVTFVPIISVYVKFSK